MSNMDHKEVTVIEGKGGKFRWAAISAMLLAIGAILRLVSPSIAGISPNWIIAMYCLAIILTKPSLGRAAGIGLVAGAVCLATSKSIFPYGNLISETVGAVVCAILVNAGFNVRLGSLNLKPALCTMVGTLCSGFTFVTIAKLALSLPDKVYFYGMLPVVLTVTVINTVVAQLLYFPAQRIFGGETSQSVTRQKVQ
ncbi:MAG TPA: tryptophan transporter [Patescibacteria group bacterium]|nr:tryptophan transporter [Patescibacteria group bacterium]